MGSLPSAFENTSNAWPALPAALQVPSGWITFACLAWPDGTTMVRSTRDSIQRVEILTAVELGRTLDRLASQVLESAGDPERLLLVGIPTRGVALAKVLAVRLEAICGRPILCGSVDPTFHRDDLQRVGTRLVEATDLPSRLDGGQVVLVDDVIFTGRTVRAALEALQAWGRPTRVFLLTMIDRGHRELPIQPDFCGRIVPTSRQETIELCLRSIDGVDGVYLTRPSQGAVD